MKWICAYVIMLFVLLCGCEAVEIPLSTEPPVVQISGTTEPATQPHETTLPPEETVPVHPLHEQYEMAGFEYYSGEPYQISDENYSFQNVIYRHTGIEGTVHIPSMNLTLTIPTEWEGKVEILLRGENGTLYVIGKEMTEAVCKLRESHEEGHKCVLLWDNYLFYIFRDEKTSPDESWEELAKLEINQMHPRVYLGETDEYFFFINSPYYLGECGHCPAGFYWYDIEQHFGTEEFERLRDSLPVTVELVQEMVTFHNAPD